VVEVDSELFKAKSKANYC